ncbi:MAG: hypothetical protein ABEK00_02895 [Candidatus Nanohaloarchaea archaeon]
MDREKTVTGLKVLAVLSGLLVVPPLIQHLYNVNAVKITFGIIILYYLFNRFYLKKQDSI